MKEGGGAWPTTSRGSLVYRYMYGNFSVASSKKERGFGSRAETLFHSCAVTSFKTWLLLCCSFAWAYYVQELEGRIKPILFIIIIIASLFYYFSFLVTRYFKGFILHLPETSKDGRQRFVAYLRQSLTAV